MLVNAHGRTALTVDLKARRRRSIPADERLGRDEFEAYVR